MGLEWNGILKCACRLANNGLLITFGPTAFELKRRSSGLYIRIYRKSILLRMRRILLFSIFQSFTDSFFCFRLFNSGSSLPRYTYLIQIRSRFAFRNSHSKSNSFIEYFFHNLKYLYESVV